MSSSSRRAAAADGVANAVAVAAAWLAGAAAWLLGASVVLAASPSPSAAAGGDPRSAGQGPGLVGDPLFAIGAVVLIGTLAVGATLLYVRATGGSRRT